MSPGRAARTSILSMGGLGVPVIAAPSMPAAQVVAVDTNGFYSAFGGDPEIDVSDVATVHFEDTSPQALGLAGSPTVPIRSFFQQNLPGFD